MRANDYGPGHCMAEHQNILLGIAIRTVSVPAAPCGGTSCQGYRWSALVATPRLGVVPVRVTVGDHGQCFLATVGI